MMPHLKYMATDRDVIHVMTGNIPTLAALAMSPNAILTGVWLTMNIAFLLWKWRRASNNKTKDDE